MKKTLLVVDDEIGVRTVLEHYLGDEFNVISKENGFDAFEWISAGNKPDLVLADIEMPKLDGYELLMHIRSNSALQELPYLMVSGKNKQDNYVKSFRLGANDYISKPFSAAEVKEKIHRYL